MEAIYLTHITVTGLFGYKNLSWDVFKDVNILGGGNGSGKSTVFQICHLLIGVGYINDARYARLVSSVKLEFSNGYSMTWDKIRSMKDSEHEAGYSYFSLEGTNIEKDGSFVVQRVKVMNGNGDTAELDDIIAKVGTSHLSAFEQNILDSKKVEKNNESEDRTYLARLLTSYISYRNARVSQILINSLSQGNQGGDGEHRFVIGKKDAEYIFLFNDALKVFFGENYEIKAGMEAQISMTSKKTGELIKYQELSLGEKEMLLLIVFISNTFDDPVLVWLDEPDLGLHVDWQEKLIGSLRRLNPNMQLFVSTHAPSMVEGNFEKVAEMSHLTRENA